MSYDQPKISATEKTLLETLRQQFIRQTDAWAAKDAYLYPIVTTLRLAFHQSQVRIEDYYMDKGLSASEARTAALAVLHEIVY
ncbi:MAG: hypothetical protein R2795_00045 [Saprospiraceae bacterium]